MCVTACHLGCYSLLVMKCVQSFQQHTCFCSKHLSVFSGTTKASTEPPAMGPSTPGTPCTQPMGVPPGAAPLPGWLASTVSTTAAAIRIPAAAAGRDVCTSPCLWGSGPEPRALCVYSTSPCSCSCWSTSSTIPCKGLRTVVW